MFFCECLNIIGEVSDVHKKLELSSVKINPVQTLSDTSYFELLDFFKLALGPIGSAKISIQHEAFVSKERIDSKWIVSKCLNCDCTVFASDDASGAVLINGKMLRDKHLLLETIKNENYSMPFKIILKPVELLPNKSKSAINNDARSKQLFEKLQDYLSRDETETEAEIRRLREALVQRRQQAEREFQLMVTLISSLDTTSNGVGSSSNIQGTPESTNMSTENIQSFSITPPVTPESAQMTIDQAPPLTKLMSNNNHHHYLQQREGISKHNNAMMQKQTTRAIEFEDDIFELDGMQGADAGEEEEEKSGNEGARDEQDRYHKYSDTEGGDSDTEEMMIEKRPYLRGRSGSLAIARSAPISMPQFMHHANPHLEEKHVNEQDIAGGIRLLAKSIHADSIFGELPNRHVFKYNAEF